MQVNETVTGFCGDSKQFTTKSGGYVKPSFSGVHEEIKQLYQTLENLKYGTGLPFKAEKKPGYDYTRFSVGNMVFNHASYHISSASYGVHTPEKHTKKPQELLAA